MCENSSTCCSFKWDFLNCVCSRYVRVIELCSVVTWVQESLCAAFGAGLSTACVVDIGAVKTSIACVDEGQVVPDTRCVWAHLAQLGERPKPSWGQNYTRHGR